LYANVSGAFQNGQICDRAAQLIGNKVSLSQRRGAGLPKRRARFWSSPMSIMNDLKKYAVGKMKQRRHRQVVSYLNSLPREVRKDIGWHGDLDSRFE
jgi:hypothetical protein